MNIINNSKDLNIFSLSLVTCNYFEQARQDEELEQAHPVKQYTVYTVCEIGFICAALVGVIETVFWAAIALLYKIPHLFIPKSHSKWPDLIYAQIYSNLNGSVTGLAESSVLIVINYFEKNDSLKDTLIKVSGSVDRALEKGSNFFSYQLFN